MSNQGKDIVAKEVVFDDDQAQFSEKQLGIPVIQKGGVIVPTSKIELNKTLKQDGKVISEVKTIDAEGMEYKQGQAPNSSHIKTGSGQTPESKETVSHAVFTEDGQTTRDVVVLEERGYRILYDALSILQKYSYLTVLGNSFFKVDAAEDALTLKINNSGRHRDEKVFSVLAVATVSTMLMAGCESMSSNDQRIGAAALGGAVGGAAGNSVGGKCWCSSRRRVQVQQLEVKPQDVLEP